MANQQRVIQLQKELKIAMKALSKISREHYSGSGIALEALDEIASLKYKSHGSTDNDVEILEGRK